MIINKLFNDFIMKIIIIFFFHIDKMTENIEEE